MLIETIREGKMKWVGGKEIQCKIEKKGVRMSRMKKCMTMT